MFRSTKQVWLAATAVAAGVVLTLSACTGTGAVDKQKDSNTQAAASTSGKYTFAVITHAAPGDTFWDVVKTGAMAGGKAMGDKVTYQGDPDVQKQSQLIESAIAQKVDGLVVSMANPEGLKGALADATKAGIPFVTINSGLAQSQEYGAITHVGQDEELAGESVGKRLDSEGLKNVLCIIHEAGNQGLEQRCDGIKKTFTGTVKNVQVDINNVADAGNTIKSALLSDTSVDGVVALNPEVAVAAEQARDNAGSKAKVATFDVSSDVLKLIEQGKILFAVDQQQYLQGYLPIVFLHLYKSNGNTVGGGMPVYSGPGYITKDNAAQVAKYAKNGTR
ncbi:sugar ABC transporter substrate-binding protein [Humibacter albus]|uniref:sugar ABC transporter substrate-binding protein n=1 Tax=Humibacter albus TaxID=427754 RepID=UPI0003B6B13C|nr:sugar ABC transporter substrate-binding protein [Humibacter albus]